VSIPDALRRLLLRVLPWYNAAEVEARHADTAEVITQARASRRRADRLAASYRAAGKRLER
jgi:hypothetical protein